MNDNNEKSNQIDQRLSDLEKRMNSHDNKSKKIKKVLITLVTICLILFILGITQFLLGGS